nr:MAG TPA: head closure knob [Caudoviricetes sp.]
MQKYVEVILIKETYVQTEKHEQRTVRQETPVIGTLSSVTASEFYQAANTDYRPEIVLKVYEQEYSGQQKVRVNDVQYTVIRTYLSGDFIELHCQRKGAD